jgi:hypothetical protein
MNTQDLEKEFNFRIFVYRDLFDEYKHLKGVIKSKHKELSALKFQQGSRENYERLVVVEAALRNIHDMLPEDFRFNKTDWPGKFFPPKP